jgi:L-lactate dehydrogenase complex protein LldE
VSSAYFGRLLTFIGMRLGLFVPCYINEFYPQVGIACYQLLQRLGYSPEVPLQQTCCGQPLANSGFESKAKSIYAHFVETFNAYDYTIAPSASCVYHVRKHYDILDPSPRVEHIKTHTLDLIEFLVDVLKIETIEARFPYKVALHQSCHGLRGLRMAQSSERVLPYYNKWESLLHKVQGLELIKTSIADECCGFGGTFAIDQAALSVKMGTDKIQDAMSSGAEYITSGDMSCLMHLDGVIQKNKLPLQVIHIAEILNRVA